MADITIFQAKKIITMNPGNPEGTHIAVREGRILGVGSLDDVAGWGDYELDDTFKDQVLVPGFVEAHGHIQEGAFWEFAYVGYFDRMGADGKLRKACRSFEEIIEAQYGAAPLQFLLGIETVREIAAVPDPDHDNHHHETEYETCSHVSDKPLVRPLFERFAAGLPESVIRAKGILYLADTPERRTVFQLVGQRRSMTPGDEWGQAKPETRLVLIGLKNQIDQTAISRTFEEYVLNEQQNK